jgi:hypothetical protein
LRIFHHVFRHRQVHAPVDVLLPVRPGPTVLRTERHVGEVIGHEIGAEHVALVDHGPEFPGIGIEVHAIGIAHAAGKLAHAVLGEVIFKDRGAIGFGFQAVVGNIGADPTEM